MFKMHRHLSSRLFNRSFFTVINQAEIAYREMLGTNRVRLEPGIRLNIPIIHNVKRIDMRENIVEVPSLNAYTKDNVPVNVTGTLFYKAIDAEKACYAVRNYKSAVAAVGESCFRVVVGRFEFDEIIAHRNQLNAEMINILGNSLNDWGIMCSRCEIQHVGPQTKTIAHQLEKQMEAERRRRENELDTLAKIKTAEGNKQTAILESEGKFISEKNIADAAFYKMNKETESLATQVQNLTSVSGDAEKAMKLLLEYKRLEHLCEISKKDNRVYFLSPESAYPVPSTDLINNQLKLK